MPKYLPLTSVLLVLSFFLLNFCVGDVQAIGCPEKCSCQQRTVRCLRQQLDKIPAVPLDTNIIDLRYNHIREIPTNAFTGLKHLHTIFLNENQVVTIQQNAFAGLPSLKYLYLNKNRISQIADNAFRQLDRLQSLYLQYNNISSFEAATFSNLPNLERLSMKVHSCCWWLMVLNFIRNKVDSLLLKILKKLQRSNNATDEVLPLFTLLGIDKETRVVEMFERLDHLEEKKVGSIHKNLVESFVDILANDELLKTYEHRMTLMGNRNGLLMSSDFLANPIDE